MPPNSKNIIHQHFEQADLRTYFVGFDFGEFRYDALTELLMDSIVDFAFGYHTGILKQYDRRKLIEAAKSIYNIKEYQEVKAIYVDSDDCLNDCEIDLKDKYLKRGEFGELILHVLLRDFVDTIPLVSKIHFKDTDGATVHGFDLVHIGPDLNNPKNSSLYFGESKLYSRKNGNAGSHGISDLIDDIESHFKKDFLYREIALIGKKKYSFIPPDDYEDKNTKDEYLRFLEAKKYWFDVLSKVELKEAKLQDFLKSVTIPLVCTYQSKLYETHTDENTNEFIQEYEKEMIELQDLLKNKLVKIKDNVGEPVKTELNILLVLFPIPSKKELLKRLHTKLYNQQNA